MIPSPEEVLTQVESIAKELQLSRV